MKLFIAILSFFLGNAKNIFKQSSSALSQQMILHVRAISIVVITSIGSLAIFCTSLCLLIASIAGQYEKNDEFNFSTAHLVYSIAILISAGILCYSLRRKTWLKVLGIKQTETKASSSPIENALALLVMDFVESRQAQRKESGSEKETASV